MFLVRDAEALLLVHYEQAQALELHVLLQQPVRTDDEVALAALQVRERGAHLRRAAEAAHDLYVHGVAEKALHRRLVVLLCQYGGRHEDGRLFSAEDALHDGAQGDLGLAVAHVAAEQAVHGHGLFHVRLYLLDAAELVVRLLKAEALLKLRLPGRVGREGVALLAAALGIELDEALGQLLGRGLGAGLCALPLRAAQL